MWDVKHVYELYNTNTKRYYTDQVINLETTDNFNNNFKWKSNK